jgi:hypothetical protein
MNEKFVNNFFFRFTLSLCSFGGGANLCAENVYNYVLAIIYIFLHNTFLVSVLLLMRNEGVEFVEWGVGGQRESGARSNYGRCG